MKPLSKIWAYMAILSAIVTALASMADVLPPKVGAALLALEAALAALSHAIQGSGGAPNVPSETGLTKNLIAPPTTKA